MLPRKSLLVFVLCLFCVSILAGCASSGDNNTNQPAVTPGTGNGEAVSKEEKAFVDRFKQAHGEEKVLKVFCEDFDDNGVKEAFILTGHLSEEVEGKAWLNGKVWLVTEQEIELAQQDISTQFTFDPKVVSFNGVKMLHVYQEYATGAHSYLYGVEDNKLHTYFDYGIGALIEGDGETVQIVHDTYDICYDRDMKVFTGHSWKPYYFYFEKADEDTGKGNRFREYGAIEISRKQFCKFAGANGVLEQIGAKGNVEITDILYRKNGIININYKINEENGYSQYYVTVKYNDTEVYDATEGEGKYERAIIPEIATYPKFKEPQQE